MGRTRALNSSAIDGKRVLMFFKYNVAIMRVYAESFRDIYFHRLLFVYNVREIGISL